MRQIKFRAYDSLNKKMLFSVPGKWNDRDPVYDIARIKVPEVKDKFGRYFDYEALSDFMQYTGLKDKNGVEIYEGDIVKTPHYIIGEEPAYYENRVVKYFAPSFGLAAAIDEEYDVNNFSTPLALEEVIGNIYENPELLESK